MNKESLIDYLKNYQKLIVVVLLLSFGINFIGLLFPIITSNTIDSIRSNNYSRENYILVFGGFSFLLLILELLQNIVSSITAEKIAAGLRNRIIEKLSKQTFSYINSVSSAKLLTNITSDVDSVKNFISQGLVSVVASILQLIGSSLLLLYINWKLALPVLFTVPILFVAFGIIFKSISKYFKLSKEAIDKLNNVINESIVGAALIRVLNSRYSESEKFEVANDYSKFVGTKIVTGFASLVPIINLVLNLGFLIVLSYGGIQIINGTLSQGEFAAFFLYIFTFILPVIILGFLGSTIGAAFASYSRIMDVVSSKVEGNNGKIKKDIQGELELKDVSLDIDNRSILNNISFKIKSKSRTGIIGPTASGKTQIFYLITGLILPKSGDILIDGKDIKDYDIDYLYSKIGIVFQDSLIFNTSLRENIAFKADITEADIWKAIETAELREFVEKLPNGLDTIISERGSSLSGGQKQRLTLARALSINPKLLLLDDFTARVDIQTEQKIFDNLKKNYPDTTIVAITQKISSVMDFDNVILMMEGEILATGNHKDLLNRSFEYQQIFNSQKSTN